MKIKKKKRVIGRPLILQSYFIVHLLCGCVVFILKFKFSTFFLRRYEMQDAGITSDTMMKNFFFVPSCIQLSQEDNFSTEA